MRIYIVFHPTIEYTIGVFRSRDLAVLALLNYVKVEELSQYMYLIEEWELGG